MKLLNTLQRNYPHRDLVITSWRIHPRLGYVVEFDRTIGPGMVVKAIAFVRRDGETLEFVKAMDLTEQ